MRSSLLSALLFFPVGYTFTIAAELSSRSLSDVSSLFSHHAYSARRVRRKLTDVHLSHEEAYLQRRVDTAAPGAPSSSAAPSDNAPKTPAMIVVKASAANNTTDAACLSQLTALNGKASNPSGLAACYNIPEYDNSTGAFQADLSMWKVCEPTGDWEAVKQDSAMVVLSYGGATVASQKQLKRRGLGERAATPSAPTKVTEMTFVGMVNNETLSQWQNATAMRDALVPVIYLSATTSTDKNINTTVSATEASFIDGAFTRAASAGATPTPTAFVLPGVTLGIFPTGLIITSIWAAMFITSVGLGTLGRYNFRRAYRRRIRAETASRRKPY